MTRLTRFSVFASRSQPLIPFPLSFCELAVLLAARVFSRKLDAELRGSRPTHSHGHGGPSSRAKRRGDCNPCNCESQMIQSLA